MRLSQLYSNKPTIFSPIKFNLVGLNVVFAKIYHPKNNEKDNHNLGKTLLINLLDFMLLKEVRKEFFLKKHKTLFEGFEFYLEIELNKSDFVTIKRCVDQNTKISFMRHKNRFNNFIGLEQWQQQDIPIKNAVQLLDGYLNLSSIQGFSYRKGINYFLRDQNDYKDPFELAKFKGKHQDWKPYIAHLFGFDSHIIIKKYEQEIALSSKKTEKTKLANQISYSDNEYDKLRGEISLKTQEIEDLSNQLDSFDYHEQEININHELVDEIEARINDINLELYNVNFDLDKINTALAENIQFDIEEIQQIFAEANLYFSDQLVNDYDALVLFNKKMTQERHSHLKSRKVKLEALQQELELEHEKLNIKKQSYLKLLQEADFFQKYKQLQKTLDNKRANVLLLEKQLEVLEKIRDLNLEINELKTDINSISDDIQTLLENGNEYLETIRTAFNKVIYSVLAKQAQTYIQQNKKGNLDFKADFIDKTGDTTSESEGNTYKKLLCMAFDLAVLKTYASDSFSILSTTMVH